jgi:hypothetical protein
MRIIADPPPIEPEDCLFSYPILTGFQIDSLEIMCQFEGIPCDVKKCKFLGTNTRGTATPLSDIIGC